MFKYNQGTSVMALMSNVNHFQLKSSSSVMTLITSVNHQQLKSSTSVMTLSINQVSITNSDHYLLLVDLYSIKAQSTLK